MVVTDVSVTPRLESRAQHAAHRPQASRPKCVKFEKESEPECDQQNQCGSPHALEIDEQLRRSRVLSRGSKRERPFLVAVLHFVVLDRSHSPPL